VRPQKNIIRKFLLNIFRANNTEEMNGFETFTANQHRPEGWFLLKSAPPRRMVPTENDFQSRKPLR
jgi:hypothetical protein